MYRQMLLNASRKIASRRGEKPVGKIGSIRKLFIQEKRDKKTGRRVGWKRGEIFEVLIARTQEEMDEEIGDCGYYIAQSFDVFWWIYKVFTPSHIIKNATIKFKNRAEK